MLGRKLGPFVSYRVRKLEEFFSHSKLLGGPGFGFIRSHGLGCPTLLSLSVPVCVPRVFPFIACRALLRCSGCRAGFKSTLFVREILLPWGDHLPRGGGFLGKFSLPSDFLLGLASPGGGGRKSDIRACRRFHSQESPKARGRTSLVVDDFGFSQRE